MTATVTTLHPDQAASPAPTAPAGQVIAALAQMATGLIGEQLGKMFESADDVLFEMADKTRDGDQKQLFLATMRTIRLERPRLVRAFQDALHQALRRADATAAPAEVDLDDLEKWTLQESSDLEEKIAVNNMDSKAASLYARELMELEQRLTRLADDSHGTVSPKALCPARILDAFRLSMKGLDVDLPIKLVIYKLFDRVVVGNLGQVFTGANEMLAAQGIQPKGTPAPPKKTNAALWKPAAPKPSVATASGPLAAAMQSYLQGQAPATGGGGGGGEGGAMAGATSAAIAQQNAQIADEMLAVLDAAGNGRPASSWMPAQNLTLVSRMFDDFYADPQLPEAARPVLGRLQFPVMKFAMSDRSFFSNPNHPVRTLVQDVYDSLAGAQGPKAEDFQRLEQLVQDLLQRFDPNPADLRQRAQQVHPVTEEEAEQFLQQQRQRLEQQKRALQEKIRQVVAQELRLHIGERRLPKPMLPLVLSGFGPMLLAHYRAGGADHPGWQAVLALLDRVLQALDAARAAVPGREGKEAAVVNDVFLCLKAAGFPAERAQQLGGPLANVYEELAAAAPTPAPAPARADAVPGPDAPREEQETGTAAPVAEAAATPPAPAAPAAPAEPSAAERQRALATLLQAGHWFRVWCADSQNCRWLKLTGYYAGADTVMFEDFGGEQRMKMSAAAFAQDLAGGRSSPVDPDPAHPRLLALLPRSDAPRESRLEWMKAPAAPAAAAA